MSKSDSSFMMLDEYQLPHAETLWLKRMRRSFFSYRGWLITEKFDDRYDTEVGGMQTMVTQWVEHGDQPIESNNIADLDIRQSTEVVERTPAIVDYITGEHFSLAQLEDPSDLRLVAERFGGEKEAVADQEQDQMKAVAERLRERILEYKAFVEKLQSRDSSTAPDSVLQLGYTYTEGQSKDMEAKGQSDEH